MMIMTLKTKGVHFVDKGISEVDSKSHLPLQFMDLVLGAICFRLNEKGKLKSDGEKSKIWSIGQKNASLV